jgi:hypothetical protein
MTKNPLHHNGMFATPEGMNRDQIKTATRAELIDYLESWGFQCYDHESTSTLRDAALENYNTEES